MTNKISLVIILLLLPLIPRAESFASDDIVKYEDKDGKIVYSNIETNKEGLKSVEIIERSSVPRQSTYAEINYQLENLFNDSNTKTKLLSDLIDKRNDLGQLLFNYQRQLEETQFELNANTVKLDKCNINAVYDYFIFFCSGLEIKQERLLNELDLISNNIEGIRSQIIALDLQINEIGTQNETVVCKVKEILSGETFLCAIGDGLRTVKLIGVEAPDSSGEFLESLILEKNVRLKFDNQKTDFNNNLLAYVFIDDSTMLNALLLRQGMAMALSNSDYKYIYEFKEYERLAKETNTGIWGYD